MATGNFGTIRPSDVDVKDIEILYSYSPSRETTVNTMTGTISSSNLIPIIDPNATTRVLGGLYNLTLPKTVFNTKGIYNVYMRPKIIQTSISDCGVLSAFPNIKGIVLDSSDSAFANFQEKTANGGLVGFRVEYLNADGSRMKNLFRIITNSYRCEPVTDSVNNTSDKAIRYRLNDQGTLIFCTLSPTSVSSIKPNTKPFIGEPGGEILLSNTFFDPIHLEVELTDVTIESLGNILMGNITESADGVVTYYDENNEIFEQYDVFDIQDNPTLGQRFRVKKRRKIIDVSKQFDTIDTFSPQ